MAVNVKTIPGTITTATALTLLKINRSLVNNAVVYSISLTYADYQYISDENGEITQVIAQNINPRTITYSQEQMQAFYGTLIKFQDNEMMFGDFLANQLDTVIAADMENPLTSTMSIPLSTPPVVNS